MRLFKLTDTNGQTRGGTQWGAGITHTLPTCDYPQLCSDHVLHAYRDLDLALALNPIHADIPSEFLRLWEAEGDICADDWGKVGVFSLTTTHELPIPEWYSDVPTRLRVLVQFAQECAEAARAGEAGAAMAMAMEAAMAAEAAAGEAARAARAARAAMAAEAAAMAAMAAEAVAREAARAAMAAVAVARGNRLDLAQILRDAIKEEINK